MPLRIVVLADGRIAGNLPLMNKYLSCISNEYLLWEDKNNNEESKHGKVKKKIVAGERNKEKSANSGTAGDGRV